MDVVIPERRYRSALEDGGQAKTDPMGEDDESTDMQGPAKGFGVTKQAVVECNEESFYSSGRGEVKNDIR